MAECNNIFNQGDLGDVSWANTNHRLVISASLLSADGLLKLTFADAGNTEYVIDSVFVGIASDSGDAYDFNGGQKQVTFNGGNSGFTYVPGSGVDQVSDEILFSIDPSKDLVVSWYKSSGGLSFLSADSIIGTDYFFKTGADESSVSDVSGYTAYAGTLYVSAMCSGPTIPSVAVVENRIGLGSSISMINHPYATINASFGLGATAVMLAGDTATINASFGLGAKLNAIANKAIQIKGGFGLGILVTADEVVGAKINLGFGLSNNITMISDSDIKISGSFGIGSKVTIKTPSLVCSIPSHDDSRWS